MFCLGTGPILLWFMVGSQQTHFQAGSEHIQTGNINLLGCQEINLKFGSCELQRPLMFLYLCVGISL